MNVERAEEAVIAAMLVVMPDIEIAAGGVLGFMLGGRVAALDPELAATMIDEYLADPDVPDKDRAFFAEVARGIVVAGHE